MHPTTNLWYRVQGYEIIEGNKVPMIYKTLSDGKIIAEMNTFIGLWAGPFMSLLFVSFIAWLIMIYEGAWLKNKYRLKIGVTIAFIVIYLVFVFA